VRRKGAKIDRVPDDSAPHEEAPRETVPDTITDMNAQFQEQPEVAWPAPPMFRFETPPPAALCACTIEYVDGPVIGGLLVEFSPDTNIVNLWPHDGVGPQAVAISRVRCIRLTEPARYAAEPSKPIAGDGSGPNADSPQPFVVLFRDGATLQGATLGVKKIAAGSFLYVAEADGGTVINCFIPAGCIQELRMSSSVDAIRADTNPPDAILADAILSDAVAALVMPAEAVQAGSPDVKAATLLQALNKQSQQRNDKVGQYLAPRAIKTSDDLIRALHVQGKRPNARLGDILIEAGAITKDQLAQALAVQSQHKGRRLGDILIDIGAVSGRLIQVALSDKLGIPYVNVREFPIGLGVLETITTAFAIRHQVLPLLQTTDRLIVAVENPLAVDFLQDLRFQNRTWIDPVIADPQELKERISKEYSGLDNRVAVAKADAGGPSAFDVNAQLGVSALQANVADLTSQLARETKSSARTAKEVVNDPRVSENTLVRLVNKIIIEGHAQGASDIHIESNGGNAYTRIRFRKDGELEDYLDLPQAYSNSLVSRIKIMAELDISERRHPQDGKIDFGKHGPLAIELRVAIIPTANGLEDVVLRILSAAEALPLDQVGFSPKDLASLKKMISRSFGLVLVCGPTGSGKTTTLHSVLREINTPDLKIWTAEDPVEITQRGLRQVQVNAKIDWTFAAAMRAFLRADPDVIMVGEMRDVETTKIGIEASLTGHLVFSTLHTNSAAESVVRLLDLGMDPFNFADALIGVLSQRLARKLCPTCKHARIATAEEVADLVEEYCANTDLDRAEVLRGWQRDYWTDGHLILREPSGCDACKDGYKGRVVVYELLAATPAIKHMIRAKTAVPQMLAVAQQEGMLSLRQNTLHHVLRGILDLTSARSVSS